MSGNRIFRRKKPISERRKRDLNDTHLKNNHALTGGRDYAGSSYTQIRCTYIIYISMPSALEGGRSSRIVDGDDKARPNDKSQLQLIIVARAHNRCLTRGRERVLGRRRCNRRTNNNMNLNLKNITNHSHFYTK